MLSNAPSTLAAERKHEYATLEHLLLALTEDEDAAEVMTACKLDIEKLRRDLANYLDNDCASFVVEDGGQVHPTAAFQRVVQRAVLHVESSSKRRSHRRQRPRLDLRRARQPRRLFPARAGHDAL